MEGGVSHCGPHGVCIDGLNTFLCICKERYDGVPCTLVMGKKNIPFIQCCLIILESLLEHACKHRHHVPVHVFYSYLAHPLHTPFVLSHCLAEPPIQPVMITKSPKSVHAEINDQVNLTCLATGDPPISYRWERDGQALPGQTFPYLLIPKVNPDDRGAYVCIASNERSSRSSEPALVTIRGEY